MNTQPSLPNPDAHKGGWKKGQSGNPSGLPRGRVPFGIILDDLLTKTEVVVRGQVMSGKQWLAMSLLEGVMTGTIPLIVRDGVYREVKVPDSQWVEQLLWKVVALLDSRSEKQFQMLAKESSLSADQIAERVADIFEQAKKRQSVDSEFKE